MIEISLADDAWEDTGDEVPGGRLATTIFLNGVPMHFEAIEVRGDREVGQQAVDQTFAESLDLYSAAANGGAPFCTTTIHGREYVVVATPFCN